MSDEVKPMQLPTEVRAKVGLYYMTLAVLGVALLFGLVAWFVIALKGKTMPEGFSVIIGTLVGGLVGVITSPSNAAPGGGAGGT